MRKLCVICRRNAEIHHVKSRGSGGGEDEWNKILLCRMHHSEIHQLGNSRFAEKYTGFYNWLVSNGWIFDEYKGKWTHYD